MSISTNSAKVCDLTNGRIVFNTETMVALAGSNQIHAAITDATNAVHEFSADISGGELGFNRASLPDPIRSFKIFRASDGQTIFEAQNLFPTTDREFEAQFKSHRDRSGDPYVDYFVASQIFDHFRGQEGYRISAAVVVAYKAIELLNAAYLEAAESRLRQALSAIPKVKLARSTRNNREHLHISVLCALYHVQLARGDAAGFVQTIMTLKGLLENHSFESYYNLAYNGCLSLRLLTLLQVLAGQREAARTTATLSFDVFKRACGDADENLAHFKELRYVHDNTYETMRIARRVKDVSESLIDKTLGNCLRVSAEKHPDSSRIMQATYLESTQII